MIEPVVYEEAHTCLDALDVPYFLHRNPDGSMKYPELWVPSEQPRVARAAVEPRPMKDWTDAELLAALETLDISVTEKQPIYREMLRRDERRKKNEGLTAFKEKHAGERWDPKQRRWIRVTETVTFTPVEEDDVRVSTDSSGVGSDIRPALVRAVPVDKVVPEGFSKWLKP